MQPPTAHAHAGTRATTSLLLTFSVVAFAVTALVIANTFGVRVAQRATTTVVAMDADGVAALGWESAAVGVLTLGSAWLASVLPDVRAARVPPAAALAEE